MNVKNVLFLLSSISCGFLQGMQEKPIARDILGKTIIDLNQLGKQEKSPTDLTQLRQNIYQENYSILQISPRSALGLQNYLADKINGESTIDNEVVNKMICFCLNGHIQK